jgi:hypothetical protein
MIKPGIYCILLCVLIFSSGCTRKDSSDSPNGPGGNNLTPATKYRIDSVQYFYSYPDSSYEHTFDRDTLIYMNTHMGWNVFTPYFYYEISLDTPNATVAFDMYDEYTGQTLNHSAAYTYSSDSLQLIIDSLEIYDPQSSRAIDTAAFEKVGAQLVTCWSFIYENMGGFWIGTQRYYISKTRLDSMIAAMDSSAVTGGCEYSIHYLSPFN